MRQTPFNYIKKTLSSVIPLEMIHHLPDKWEKIGTIVTIKLPEELSQYKQIIGKAYAEELGCTAVLNDVGGISGVYRKPVVEVIFGSAITETIHSENGIHFKVDPQKIMFSSGNMGERRRIATIAHKNEIVVDLFAGVGYFTLPMAVYSQPKKIFACEINPVAFKYLCANVVLNHVSTIVEPLFGDNRESAPKDCADRVILGYLKDPQEFLWVALECLRNNNGVLHYHELVPVEFIPEQPLSHIEKAAKQYYRSVELLKVNKIKSYAPRIDHMVLDVRILE
jgi:tRNA wybutosine-synthesizing protein 2